MGFTKAVAGIAYYIRKDGFATSCSTPLAAALSNKLPANGIHLLLRAEVGHYPPQPVRFAGVNPAISVAIWITCS